MKKLFVLVLALLLSISVFAEGISREEALQYARRFFSDTPKAALDIVWEGDHADNPAFYVINREGGGFLILSGEMAVNPLLGYSYTGTFRTQGMPVHMKDWFGGLERDINHVREMKSVPKEKVLREWEALGVRTKAGGTEHVIESAQWDQGAPYNKYCPTGSNGHKCVTGCVATAMAIVLRHNMYPAHGYGELRTYTTSSQKIYVEGYSIEDHEYKWDMMPLTGVSRASTECQEQIAQLMYDCGVMIQMDYSPSGSGAVSMYMPSVIAEHMAYSPETLLYRKSMYKNKEWLELIKSELDQDRLVFYSAQDASGKGGHAFVIDGYDDSGLLRVNWGWSGHGNAFYNLDLEVDGYRFSNDQGAVLGLIPDPDRSGKSISFLAITGKGVSLASGKIEEGKTFSLDVRSITNYGNGEYSGPIVAVLTDENDVIKEQISDPKNITVGALSNGDVSISNCSLKSTPNFKDRVAVAVRNSAGAYEVLRRDVEAESVGSLATIPNFIAGKSAYSTGETYKFALFKSGEPFRSVTWYFDGQKIPEDEDSVVLSAGTHVVKAILTKTNGTETLVKEIIVN